MDIKGFCTAFGDIANSFLSTGSNLVSGVLNQVNCPPCETAGAIFSNFAPVLQTVSERTQNIWQIIQSQVSENTAMSSFGFSAVSLIAGFSSTFAAFKADTPTMAIAAAITAVALILIAVALILRATMLSENRQS